MGWELTPGNLKGCRGFLFVVDLSVMKPDQLLIVPEKYLLKVEKRALAWRVGWIAALVMACFLGMVLYTDHILIERFNKLNKEFKELQESQKKVDISQKQTTIAFVQAWENQQEAIKTVVAWGEYIKERDDLSKHNGSSGPKLIPAIAVSLGGKHGH